MKFVIILFISMFSFCVHAKSVCTKDGKFRYYKSGEEIIEKASYCFDDDKKTLESPNCQDKKCEVYKKIKIKIPMQKLLGEFGSPGFKLCYQYDGQPQLIDVYSKEKWVKMDRCTFKEDGSFIDIPTLLGLMLKK